MSAGAAWDDRELVALGFKGHIPDEVSVRNADSLLSYLGASSLRARDLRGGGCWTHRIQNC